MPWHYLVILLLAAIPRAIAQGLPDLGEPAQGDLSPLQERRLGESIMREARLDRAFYDDTEVSDYLNKLGLRLAAHSTDARQYFEFFLLRDNQINAFALPGGFIGVHTGLILNAQSESEAASVLAHEIAHVTQRHIARMFAQQKQSALVSLATMALAILAARSSSQAGEAAVALGQAGVIQAQLNFTRDAEREADRVGLQILERAGFDPRAMVTFFERLQRSTRVYEGGAPSYLRTHPLTFERIADVQNRIESLPYRQVADGLEFQMMRAKLRAELEAPRDAVAFFREGLAERRYLSESSTRYGLTLALLRMEAYAAAKQELQVLRKALPANASVETVACRVQLVSGEVKGALSCYEDALRTFPHYRALALDYADALLARGQADVALKFIEGRLQAQGEDYKLYLLQARAYAMLGKRLAQHRAQGEAYARMGNITGAVEQMQLAVKSGDADFFMRSSAEARLRELRKLNDELRRDGVKR